MRAVLKDRPVRISLDVGSIPYATADQLAVGWVSAEAPLSWTRADVPEGGGVVTLDLPASAGAPLALALWPAVGGKGHGIELRAVRLELVSAAAPAPAAAPVAAPEASPVESPSEPQP